MLGDATHPARIVQLFWGSFWSGYGSASYSETANAWSFLGNHPAFTNATLQYGAGNGIVDWGPYAASSPPASVSDHDVQTYLQAVLPRGWGSGRSRDQVFVVFLPPGVTSTTDVAAGTDGHHWTFYDENVDYRVPVVTVPWHDDLDGRTLSSARGVLAAIAHPDVAEGGRREVVEACDSQGPYRLNGYLVPRVYSNRECGCVSTVGLGRSMKDFTRDGLADILWHNPSSGLLSAWSIGKDDKVKSYAYVDWTLTGNEWIARGTGDFNGDRKPDVLWHNASTGQIAIWYMNGTTTAGYAYLDQTSLDTALQLRGTGDFNHDGKLDLVWHNAGTGEVVIWYLDGNAHVWTDEPLSRHSYGTSPMLVGTGDFDGDGYSELLWHNPTTGALSTWKPNEEVYGTEPVLLDGGLAGNDWKVMGTQDFDNDGLIDLMWHNAVTGQVWLWKLSGYKVSSISLVDWTATSPWKIISR